MNALARYEEACSAVAAARTVDAAKALRDKSEALRVYARQAKNRQLEIDAAEIRLRAERRIGELMAAQRAANEWAQPGPKPRSGPDAARSPTPSLAEAGIDKHLADRARKYAALPAEAFEACLDERRALIEAENRRVTVNLFDLGDKADKRAAREAALADRIVALPERRYGVIVADPEWRFDVWSRETGLDRAADNHYPTSITEVIAARDVPAIAADDCVLFLWGTVPMLPQALLVMGAWGFDYKTSFVWAKDRIGTGYWNRNRHEYLLLGTRGAVPCPAMGRQWESLLAAPVAGHSAKPDLFLELVEAYFPTLPKIELNRRGPARPGWDAWGNEAHVGACAGAEVAA